MRVKSFVVLGLSMAGLITGAIFACKAVENYKVRKKDNSEKPVTKILKTAKDIAIPAACVAISTVLAVREVKGLYSENLAYSTTYYHNKDKLTRLQTEGREVFGNKRWSGFMDEFYADYIYSDLIGTHTPELTGFGTYLCYDTYQKRYFRSNIEQLRRSEQKIADSLKSGKNFMSVNDFYKVNKLSTRPECEFVGWKKPEDVIFTHSIHMAGGEPCCIVCYEPSPKFIEERRMLT